MVAGSLATINEARNMIGYPPKDGDGCDDIMYDQTNRDTINNMNKSVGEQQLIFNGNGTSDN